MSELYKGLNNYLKKIGKFIIFLLLFQYDFIACNFKVPSGGGDLVLLNSLRKLTGLGTLVDANITVSGTIKDANGNIVSGGSLDIIRQANANTYERVTPDSRVFTDTNGKFTMNLYLGTFNINVSRSDNSFVGSFSFRIASATAAPDILSSSGLEVSGLSAAPVGSGGGGASGGSTTVTVTTITNSISVSSTFSQVPEGSSGLLKVSLTGTLNEATTITVTSSNPSAIKVGTTVTGGNITNNIISGGTVSGGGSSTTYNFTVANASVEQNLYISALEDANLENETVTLTFTSPKTNSYTTTIKTIDNDAVNLIIAKTDPSASDATITNQLKSLTTLPSGVSYVVLENQVGCLDVKLNSAPTGNLVVTFTSSSTSKMLIKNSSQNTYNASTTLTFDSTNFSTAQKVYTQGQVDADKNSDYADLNITATGVSPVTVNFMIIDKDVNIVTTSVPLTAYSTIENFLLEGTSKTFTVKLDTDPVIDRVINITVPNSNSLGVTPNTFTFTSLNYNTAQTFTLAATNNDPNSTDETSQSISITPLLTYLLPSPATVAIGTDVGGSNFTVYDKSIFRLDISSLDDDGALLQ